MPIYEYVCRNCGEAVERLQRMSDEPLTECPACHQPELKRKVSAAGFRLSGGGWYETDFKSDGKRNLSNKDDSTSKSDSADSGSTTKTSDSGGTGKSESKDSASKPAGETSKSTTKSESKTASGSKD